MTAPGRAERISFPATQLVRACELYGPLVKVPPGLDGVLLLWALSGNESSYAANCGPRHEPIYCTGKYAAAPAVVQLTKRFGHDAHCSFGPWQLLLVNAPGYVPAELRDDINKCAEATVGFLNRETFARQHAQTLAHIGDAYNSGNFRDKIVPLKYIKDLYDRYLKAMQKGLTL
jgi:hypothetical protein